MASGSTTRVGVPYPLSSDSAVIASDIQGIATFIDSEVPIYYQSASAPVFESGTATNGAVGGEFWWCTNPASSSYGLNYWNGSAWQNVVGSAVYISNTSPSTPFLNQVWYDTTNPNGNLKYYNGSAWVNIIPTTTTNGLVLTSSSSGPIWTTVSGLPSLSGATNGQVLTVVSGVAAWASIPSYSGATTTAEGLIQLSGDLGGTATSPTVTSVTHVSSGVLSTANGGTGVTTSTGSGNNVLSNSPTLVSPTLGAATATSINGTVIPSSATLVTTATTSLPNLTTVNGTTIPASTTLISGASPTFTGTITIQGVVTSTNGSGSIYTSDELIMNLMGAI